MTSIYQETATTMLGGCQSGGTGASLSTNGRKVLSINLSTGDSGCGFGRKASTSAKIRPTTANTAARTAATVDAMINSTIRQTVSRIAQAAMMPSKALSRMVAGDPSSRSSMNFIVARTAKPAETSAPIQRRTLLSPLNNLPQNVPSVVMA